MVRAYEPSRLVWLQTGQVHALARSRLATFRIGNSVGQESSYERIAAATAPAVGTNPISPTPLMP